VFQPWKIDPAKVICQYRLDDEVGSGGFGRVYRGILGTASVAVKVVGDYFLRADVAMKADFVREVSLLAELRHPCIVYFYGAHWPDAEALALADTGSDGSTADSCEDDKLEAGGAKRGKPGADPSRAFIVMELMSSNFSDAVRKYHLPASDVLQALRDVAEALRFMHSKGVVHIDVKAENGLV
jgi:serine/threonine protein kinase